MDRKGKQKIKYGIFVFVAILMIALLSYAKISYENHLHNTQSKEVVAIYPEAAQGIIENLDYYHKQIVHVNIIFSLIVILVVAVLLIIFFIINKLYYRRQEITLLAELELLSDHIRALRSKDKSNISGYQELENSKVEELFEQLKELEYDVNSMRVRLRDEENKTKALITDISHQLKTPLASIKMSHELSLTEDLPEAEKQSFSETVTKEILKMEALLDELVKLSRLENSMIQIHPEKIGLKDTISEAVSVIFMKARAKNISLSFHMDNDINIYHDRKWTVEAISNILENAIKYSPDNTSVQIRVSPLVSNVLIEIEDEGIGIPAGNENEIFKRFFRGDNAIEMSKDGAGVGLYLSRSILEQQGGTIVAKRKLQNGTIFKITLPL